MVCTTSARIYYHLNVNMSHIKCTTSTLGVTLGSGSTVGLNLILSEILSTGFFHQEAHSHFNLAVGSFDSTLSADAYFVDYYGLLLMSRKRDIQSIITSLLHNYNKCGQDIYNK